MFPLIDTWSFAYIVLPLLIFFARILDVSIGTIRTIFIVRGYRAIVPVLAFFEVLIWLLAVRQVMTDLPNAVTFIAYAAGFAMGNLVGMIIEEKLAVGHVLVRVITDKDATKLLKLLQEASYTVTAVGAQGPQGNVRILMTVVDRNDAHHVLNLVRQNTPDAFYSVEDVRQTSMPQRKVTNPFRSFWRKGK